MSAKNHPVDAASLMIPDASWPAGREAPAELERVRRLCNTQNMESGADILRTTAELARWLGREGFGPGRRTRDDLERVVAFRSAIRELVTTGPEHGAAAIEASLAEVAVTIKLLPSPHFSAVRGGLNAYFAALAEAIFVAFQDDTWTRLKACGHCHWVIYDQSYNRSGTWCSTRACGSRVKARAWRARQRAQARPN